MAENTELSEIAEQEASRQKVRSYGESYFAKNETWVGFEEGLIALINDEFLQDNPIKTKNERRLESDPEAKVIPWEGDYVYVGIKDPDGNGDVHYYNTDLNWKGQVTDADEHEVNWLTEEQVDLVFGSGGLIQEATEASGMYDISDEEL